MKTFYFGILNGLMWQMALKHNVLNKCKILLYLNKNTSKIKDLASHTLCSFCTAAEKASWGADSCPDD